MRSANPVLRNEILLARAHGAGTAPRQLRLGATLRNAAALLLIVLLSTWYVWARTLSMPLTAETWAALGCGVGMVFGVLICVRPTWAGVLSPLFAMCVGLLIGGASSYAAREFGGAVGVAVMGSPAAFAVMLWLYHKRLVVPEEPLRLALNIVTGGMFLLFMLTFAVAPLGISIEPLVLEPVAIAITALAVSVAALNLIVDLEAIAAAARKGAPAELEWYGAFALVVTLVWMYPEMIRMLARAGARLRR